MMIRTQLILPALLKDELENLAKKDGDSLSGVVRSLLNQALSYKKNKNHPVKSLLVFATKATSGAPADLSTNDDYLYSVKKK